MSERSRPRTRTLPRGRPSEPRLTVPWRDVVAALDRGHATVAWLARETSDRSGVRVRADTLRGWIDGEARVLPIIRSNLLDAVDDLRRMQQT